MGTSSPFGGPGGGTPLVPSWLGGNEVVDQPSHGAQEGAQPEPVVPGTPPVPQFPPIPIPATPTRFAAARNNLSRFAGTGGRDSASLGRAISHYVRNTAGGSRTAATRMGASRKTGSRLIGFLSEAVTNGAREALRTLNLQDLAGRPIEQIFIGLADFICPEGGTVDDGIAREAFFETIADLAAAGVTDLDGLTADQMNTVFELYATHTIEARLCNDIGTKIITLPKNSLEVGKVQAQLRDFIRRGVSDAMHTARISTIVLTPDRVFEYVTSVYEQAFRILQAMGEGEAEET